MEEQSKKHLHYVMGRAYAGRVELENKRVCKGYLHASTRSFSSWTGRLLSSFSKKEERSGFMRYAMQSSTRSAGFRQCCRSRHPMLGLSHYLLNRCPIGLRHRR